MTSSNNEPTPESDAESRAQWDAMLARMPPGTIPGLSFDVLTLVGANGLAMWYLVRGEMTPFELVLLVALEALLLTILARGQRLLVPRSARITPPDSGRNKIGTLLFGLVWLAVVYFAVFWMYFGSFGELRALVDDPVTYLTESSIRWPLLITLVGGLADAVSDHLHFREHGGYFVSTPEFNGLARLLTLFFGAIPFVVPLLVLGIGIAASVKALGNRYLAAGSERLDAAFWIIPGIALAMVAALGITVAGLFKLGLAGWTIGYLSAKLTSEALVMCIPFIGDRIRTQDNLADSQVA